MSLAADCVCACRVGHNGVGTQGPSPWPAARALISAQCTWCTAGTREAEVAARRRARARSIPPETCVLSGRRWHVRVAKRQRLSLTCPRRSVAGSRSQTQAGAASCAGALVSRLSLRHGSLALSVRTPSAVLAAGWQHVLHGSADTIVRCHEEERCSLGLGPCSGGVLDYSCASSSGGTYGLR